MKVSYTDVANLIANKNVVAIFQGKCEAGPRALGNRSILYDPRDPNAQEIVNTVKKREWYRPFAGTVLHEHASEWFEMESLQDSPFMLYAVKVKENKKSLISGIVHVDGTCRIQTITQEQNYHYYNLIKAFHHHYGIPILFNTSFNLGGEVLVYNEDDAIDTLNRSQINYLYLPEKSVCIS